MGGTRAVRVDIDMKNESFLKKYISFVLALTLFICMSLSCLPVNGEDAIYSKLLRLHVIADSDDRLDQALKLEVRDRVLSLLEELYEENDVCELEQAKELTREKLEFIEDAANEVLASHGVKYTARATLARESFPRKSYGDITLPAGSYDSLCVRLGAAEGKNWWCVLFPTFCLSHAIGNESTMTGYVYEEDGERFISAGFTPEEIRIITESDDGEIKIKFKILEIFASVFETEA